jgi:hypothetical protein
MFIDVRNIAGWDHDKSREHIINKDIEGAWLKIIIIFCVKRKIIYKAYKKYQIKLLRICKSKTLVMLIFKIEQETHVEKVPKINNLY